MNHNSFILSFVALCEAFVNLPLAIIFVISTLALSVISATAVNAAERQYLRNNTNNLSIAAQNSPSIITSDVAQFVGLSSDNDLVIRKTYKDADGSTTIFSNHIESMQ